MLPESKDKLCVLSLTKQGSTTSQKRIFEFKTQDQSTAFTNFLAEKKDTSVSYGDSRTVSDMNLGVFTWNVGNAEPTDVRFAESRRSHLSSAASLTLLRTCLLAASSYLSGSHRWVETTT